MVIAQGKAKITAEAAEAGQNLKRNPCIQYNRTGSAISAQRSALRMKRRARYAELVCKLCIFHAFS